MDICKTFFIALILIVSACSFTEQVNTEEILIEENKDANFIGLETLSHLPSTQSSIFKIDDNKTPTLFFIELNKSYLGLGDLIYFINPCEHASLVRCFYGQYPLMVSKNLNPITINIGKKHIYHLTYMNDNGKILEGDICKFDSFNAEIKIDNISEVDGSREKYAVLKYKYLKPVGIVEFTIVTNKGQSLLYKHDQSSLELFSDLICV